MPQVDSADKNTINRINNDAASIIIEAAEKTCGTYVRTKKHINTYNENR